MSRSHLRTELAFFAWSEEEREALAALGPVLEERADELVAAFYEHLKAFPATRALLRDPEVTARLLGSQRSYLLSLAGPRVDAAYVRSRRRIGAVHERIGLEPRWYVGAYSLYLSLLTPIVCDLFDQDRERAERTLSALQRLLLFDMQIAMEHYIERRERDLQLLNDELARSGRRLAQDLETTGVELRRTTERARAAERLASIGVLVAGLAHEIGTPMGVIQGHAKLLEKAVRGEDGQWRLQTIQEQIGRISRIIQALLNMARPGPPRHVPIQLAPLLEKTAAFLREKLARHVIATRFELEDLPAVMGDPEQLQQVFLNLFLNAADAMEGGGELVISLHASDSGDAEVLVRDTGPGIRERDRGRIFEPFFTTKEAGVGNGLGLAVAHGIVAEHGGLLELGQSGEDGSTFRVLLPLA